MLYTINTAHRALEDVKAINQVFQNDGFPMVLEHLTQRSIAQIFSDWETKNATKLLHRKLFQSMAREQQKAMDNCLVQLKLTSNKIHEKRCLVLVFQCLLLITILRGWR